MPSQENLKQKLKCQRKVPQLINIVVNDSKQTPSVNLHMVLISSSESLNNPSFSKRLRMIQALASLSPVPAC